VFDSKKYFNSFINISKNISENNRNEMIDWLNEYSDLNRNKNKIEHKYIDIKED
jgi:hypothetical protein